MSFVIVKQEQTVKRSKEIDKKERERQPNTQIDNQTSVMPCIETYGNNNREKKRK